ncbi:hypothetical protein [Halorubrum vacuolatum]|uniref:Uncharacterized protein n=1 Tax=Halorubrum vacuolatum TaxID=63740 RepID=A0A238WZK1_HALVU|nr:hypothetical protein [Halorubrum vacuolatum]SNR51838.1 hypothetical protein SAMN06264855_11183 [Halorubrum vacuolatum]
MEVTTADIDEYVERYREQEPLYPVEQESVESLPRAFRTGEYGRRDAQWVVRWYYRRYLGAFPDDERRDIETRFAGADFETVRDAIALATEATPDEYREALAALADLPGSNLAVASAFLAFTHPEEFIVIGDREWHVVSSLSELADEYPDPPTAEAYSRYLQTSRGLASDLDCDLRELYMAIWRIWKESAER